MGAMMAPKPGSTFQSTQVPAQGGKGGGASSQPTVQSTVQPTIQPTQPQTPYTPIGSQGGKGGRGPIQPQPVQPTQTLPLFNNGVNDALTAIPAQGGKAPLTPEQQAAIMTQVQQAPTPTAQPTYPTVGTTLAGNIPVTQQGVDQAKALNAGKGIAPAVNTVSQVVPKAITPVNQAITRSIPTPAQVMSPAQRRAGLSGLAGLRRR